MRQEFIIKMQGKQFEKGRLFLYLMLLCFVVTMVILMIYSSMYFIALLAPIFWIVLRLRKIFSGGKHVVEVICEIETVTNGIYVTLNSTQSCLCKSFFVDYNRVQCAHISNDGKVSITYIAVNGKNETWTFYPMAKNLEFWNNELSKMNA